MRRDRLAIPILAIVVPLIASCGGGGSGGYSAGGSGGGTTTVAGVAANFHGTKDASGTSKLNIELDDNYFEPTVIKGTPRQKLTLELENKGAAEHNLTIDAQSVDRDVKAGGKAEVTVTIPASGQLSFYCKYHKQRGMAGALEAGSGGRSGGSEGY